MAPTTVTSGYMPMTTSDHYNHHDSMPMMNMLAVNFNSNGGSNFYNSQSLPIGYHQPNQQQQFGQQSAAAANPYSASTLPRAHSIRAGSNGGEDEGQVMPSGYAPVPAMKSHLPAGTMTRASSMSLGASNLGPQYGGVREPVVPLVNIRQLSDDIEPGQVFPGAGTSSSSNSSNNYSGMSGRQGMIAGSNVMQMERQFGGLGLGSTSGRREYMASTEYQQQQQRQQQPAAFGSLFEATSTKAADQQGNSLHSRMPPVLEAPNYELHLHTNSGPLGPLSAASSAGQQYQSHHASGRFAHVQPHHAAGGSSSGGSSGAFQRVVPSPPVSSQFSQGFLRSEGGAGAMAGDDAWGEGGYARQKELAASQCMDLHAILAAKISDHPRGSPSLISVSEMAYQLSINGDSPYNQSPGATSTCGSDRSSTGGRSARTSFESSNESRIFTGEQLAVATNNWSSSSVLGGGSFGKVFKGRLAGCNVAIKRLEGGGWQGSDEYRMEVEVLSRMRHPHILLLMGHCPEEMSLVYEFMPGGTLQDYLSKKGLWKARTLAWNERVRILLEIAGGLLYLHQHNPPIAHRDLKPDNVLLDSSLNSKLGDVGLARLIAEDDNQTCRVRGTSGYIDPEEVLTCEISVLSDVYAFGLIALQLLLGEPAVKSVHSLLKASGFLGGSASSLSLVADRVLERLDESGGKWSVDVARRLAMVALRCAVLQREQRPDLASVVEPELARLAAQADDELASAAEDSDSHLRCPISKVRMCDPVIAADGFTYERKNIEDWLANYSVSPVNGEKLQHKNLIPNLSLKSMLVSKLVS